MTTQRPTVKVATVVCKGPGLVLPGVGEGKDHLPLTRFLNRDNLTTPCEAYQSILMNATLAGTDHITTVEEKRKLIPDVLIYCHDDLTVHDPDWLSKVLAPFSSDSECVAVGLGGATHLGRPNLYKRPYQIQNMARGGYCSNQTDWQVHGEHETGVKRVVVLDAFFMAIRTQFLRDVGGWPVKRLTHHCLDLWLACEAARHGKHTYVVGAECTHHGGGSSTKPEYERAAWLKGGTLASDHQAPHKWLWDEYRDVLPMEVGQ